MRFSALSGTINNDVSISDVNRDDLINHIQDNQNIIEWVLKENALQYNLSKYFFLNVLYYVEFTTSDIYYHIIRLTVVGIIFKGYIRPLQSISAWRNTNFFHWPTEFEIKFLNEILIQNSYNIA